MATTPSSGAPSSDAAATENIGGRCAGSNGMPAPTAAIAAFARAHEIHSSALDPLSRSSSELLGREHQRGDPVVVHGRGESVELVEGDTKTGRPRIVDLDADTVAVLRARKRERGALALQLARDEALIFGDLEGRLRNPEHFTHRFATDVRQCRAALGEDALPMIRLHDLRHTHATLLPSGCRRTSSRSASGTPPRLSRCRSSRTCCRAASGRPPTRSPP
jgi:hypothetical protein